MAVGTRTYSVVLSPDSDGTFTVPALPGCITQGGTVDDCLANAREAITVYLEDMGASGEPIPEETSPPQGLRVTVHV
ncbi:MAG TPA: type II toxin-antitoxin system HicB family antitoxin [Candidatus Dormibacteraeota bacterium]|nr:type II toxin-antitoxin system HicB family antitoxin [Candidatus Dormibacteraeota bacterium]